MARAHISAIALALLAACDTKRPPNVRSHWTPELLSRLAGIAGGDCLTTRETLCRGPKGSFRASRYADDELDGLEFDFRSPGLADATATIEKTLAPLDLPRAAMDGLRARLVKAPGSAEMETANVIVRVTLWSQPKAEDFRVTVDVLWLRY